MEPIILEADEPSRLVWSSLWGVPLSALCVGFLALGVIGLVVGVAVILRDRQVVRK